MRVVFDAEAGAVRADADVEDADDAQPFRGRRDRTARGRWFFGGVGVVAGEENLGFGKRPAVDVALDGDGRAEVFGLFDRRRGSGACRPGGLRLRTLHLANLASTTSSLNW